MDYGLCKLRTTIRPGDSYSPSAPPTGTLAATTATGSVMVHLAMVLSIKPCALDTSTIVDTLLGQR